ncbi:MAG TPA: biopolymer transporter ExbD [Blastocatellia bacterium]|nr:biopolymer transporter ExbD [Blastocatellia bacterium]
MGMATGSGDSSFVADINVTPMVDVMLVLLIIFMIITPALQAGVSVTLPESKNPDVDMNINKETSAVVAIPEDGQYYINRDHVQLTDLAERVKNMLKDKPNQDQIVYIKAGELVKYGTVVSVVDTLRDSGLVRIGLVTKREKQAGDTGSGAAPGGSSPPATPK